MRVSSLLAAIAVVVPIGFYAGAASAQFFEGQSILGGRSHVYEGRWCAHINSGFDRVEEDCTFDSFAACQRALMNPNFGFCTQNPGYAGRPVPPVRGKKRSAPR
jgi:hypothetical protein